MPSTKEMDYKSAGVDIDAGNRLVETIKALAKTTRRPENNSLIGAFGACFDIPARYKHPQMVAGTDGVGTKLKIATALDRHDTIGIDLVAMCANDVLCHGAEPLSFLDYFATSQLNHDQAAAVIKGIVTGCKQAGAALIGGETAEMPGIYQPGDYDLAGFCIGVVEKEKFIDGHLVTAGDALIGLASSGVHANGLSLVRHILDEKNIPLDTAFNNSTLGETLLTPTKIYVSAILDLLKKMNVHGMAHITGGGLLENVPRMMNKKFSAHIVKNSWERPPIFDWLQEAGSLSEETLFRTFNAGIGFVVAVAEEDADTAIAYLNASGETACRIGSVVATENKDPPVILGLEP